MKAKERGNAMLISAILVFGLTVTALGVSRLLVKGTQGMTTQRQFLGLQAHSLCEAGITAWTVQPAPRPVSPQNFLFPVVLARTTDTITYQATVSVAYTAFPAPSPSVFALRATTSLRAFDGTVVDRAVEATVDCAVTPCTASASLANYVGGP